MRRCVASVAVTIAVHFIIALTTNPVVDTVAALSYGIYGTSGKGKIYTVQLLNQLSSIFIDTTFDE